MGGQGDRRVRKMFNGWSELGCAACFAEGSRSSKIFSEKVSGTKTDRAQLAKALASLGEAMSSCVTRLDRLARSTRDLLNVLDAVGKAGAGFRSLADPMIDTTSPHGKLILAVLGALAEFERSMILARTAEGRTSSTGQRDQVWSEAQAHLASNRRGQG